MDEREVLVFENVCKEFPGVKALQNVSFSLKEGEVLALLGENGAGKSTLIKCLTGAYSPTSGTISCAGNKYSRLSPQLSRSLGIGAVYQEFNLVNSLPVCENVFMGNNPGNGVLVDYDTMVEKTREILDSFSVNIDPKAEVRTLSPAMMQLVEIAKAIALELKILVLDEPTAPLTLRETQVLFDCIRGLKEKGVSIIYITHRLEEIFEICDRCVILRDGQKVGERLISQTNRQELISIMIGKPMEKLYPSRKKKPGTEVVMEVSELCGNGVEDISFKLHKGEILGFAGLVGAGRTELMSLIFGEAKSSSGSISINGKVSKFKLPSDAIEEGISLVPEDRKGKGLLLDKSILINMSLASIRRICTFGVIDKKKERDEVLSNCDRLSIKCPGISTETQYLSGGNQQKIIISKWLSTNSSIMIFDEPTRGIDVGAKHEIYEIIEDLADRGTSLIVVSSEFDELIGIADRIVIMSEGHLIHTMEKDEFSKQSILDYASGNR